MWWGMGESPENDNHGDLRCCVRPPFGPGNHACHVTDIGEKNHEGQRAAGALTQWSILVASRKPGKGARGVVDSLGPRSRPEEGEWLKVSKYD